MDVSIFSHFNLKAMKPETVAQVLAQQTVARSYNTLKEVSDSVDRRRREEKFRQDRNDRGMDDVEMLAAAVYRETQIRILEQFAQDEEAARLAMERIDRRIAELDKQRRDMIEQAVELDDGRAVFLAEDGSIYTEDGEKLSDEAAEKLKAEKGAELEAGQTWEAFAANEDDIDKAKAEREALEEWNRQREEWQAKVDSGELTQEELERLEADYEASVPESVKALRDEVEARRKTEPKVEKTAAAASDATATVAIDLSGLPSERTPASAPKFGG